MNEPRRVRFCVALTTLIGATLSAGCGTSAAISGSTAPALAGNWSLVNVASTVSLGNLTIDADGNLVQIVGNPDVQRALSVDTLITNGQAVPIPGSKAYQARSGLSLSGRRLLMSISITVYDQSRQIGSGTLSLDGTQTPGGNEIDGNYRFDSSGTGLTQVSATGLAKMTKS